MCGLNAIFAYHPAANAPSRRELLATRDAMVARGPDAAGEWWSSDGRVGLGHRRLAIQDLSDRASQPMHSPCDRFVVVFNGEIYNYPLLRTTLERDGVAFRSDSDTEVLLHLYAREGSAMVTRLRGMYAFAIWDRTAKSLFLARDPYGIKPLYVADDGWTVRVASQVKALVAGGAVSREPEPAGIVGFHLWGSVPEPFTLYRTIRALPAGHSQLITSQGPQDPQCHTSIAAVFANGSMERLSQDEVAPRLRTATRASVAAHLLSDVEVGVFLSAGIDSSALLGLMRDAGQQRIRAVTLAFDEFAGTSEDEAPLAAAVANHYEAEHVIRRVSEPEFRTDLPRIFEAMDQPSIDGINTWFVAKATREAGLKVAISGVGGDEILAGYPSFKDVPRWVRWLRLPASVPGLGRAVRVLLRDFGVAASNPKAVGLLEYGGSYSAAYLLRRAVLLPFELHELLDPDLLRTGLRSLNPVDRVETALEPVPSHPLSIVASLESCHYLRNQLLRDADWAGMAHSLEIRTPLVDIDLLTALSSVQPKLKNGLGKRILASAPDRPLPASLLTRKKTGFGVPIKRWTESPKSQRPQASRLTSRKWALEVFARHQP
jgi:asparagine synthase (glutamine-hydrolysing)